MADYITWDYSSPGISFQISSGRICIFKQTLAVLEYPEFFRFRFDPQSRFFGIEPCGLEDDGAEALPNHAGDEYYDICSMSLVRFVYQTCGWNKTISYRVPGRVYGSDSHLVYFDLQKAYEIHEGRAMKVE